jgi:tRNA(adenine34) deaminase
MDDQYWMARALELGAEAAAIGEVPVGAVLVRDNQLIGEAHNAPINNHDACAHAEILAIRAACERDQNYRLPNTTLYVSLEPCAMCAGALIHARVGRVVVAAREPRAGAGGSVMNVLQHEQLNHRCEVEFGLMEEQSAQMLKAFFRVRRNRAN